MIGLNEILLVVLGLLLIVGTPFVIISITVSRLAKKMEDHEPPATKELKVSELQELIAAAMAERTSSVDAQLSELQERLRQLEAPQVDAQHRLPPRAEQAATGETSPG